MSLLKAKAILRLQLLTNGGCWLPGYFLLNEELIMCIYYAAGLMKRHVGSYLCQCERLPL